MVTINIAFANLQYDKRLPLKQSVPPEDYKLYYLGVTEMSSIESAILQHADERIVQRQNDESVPKLARSIEQRIIEKIEHAQLVGILPVNSSRFEGNAEILVDINSTGLKIVQTKTRRVIERLPLHKLVQAVAYDDDATNDNEEVEFTSHNVVLVVKRKDFSSNKSCDQCYVLQATSAAGSAHVCQQLAEAFDAIKRDVLLEPNSRNSTS